MPEHYTVGPIPRTMAQVEAENVQLRRLLLMAWRQIQSEGAGLIMMGQDYERWAVALARDLERLGIRPDGSAWGTANHA